LNHSQVQGVETSSRDSLPTQVGSPHDLQFNPQMFVEISQLMQQAAMEQHGAAYILTQDSEMSAVWASLIISHQEGRSSFKNQPSHFLTGIKPTKNL